ncbi:leucyl aminopeptidase [Aestuariispira insulae]|uniref:Probable cytosol aminopeptidase n=1 Tax=Aestuariispira insulae TaxID=1461337 RepID=A0A3D9HVH5_9PROT|nr:leucyl aminopeptidase [Aestuariispira insulae]RED53513.1 leucyl aminopeptidase [Aestuariispira insulae]
MKISFSKSQPAKGGVLVVGVEEGKRFRETAQAIDEQTGGMLSRALKTSEFKGKANQFLELVAPASCEWNRVLLAGLGKELAPVALQNLGGALYQKLSTSGEKDAAVALDFGAEESAQLAYGLKLRSYRFDKYKTKDKPSDKVKLAKLAVVTAELTEAKKLFKDLEAVAEGVFFTRDLVSEPPNILYPATLAERAAELEALGVKVEVLGEKEMKKLGMGALLGVGQGSERESKLVVMHWQGGAKKKAPLAFVGKGVTFDTGGISLKPGPGMEDMKWDMGGSGVVIGLMKALAGRKAKVNVVGIVGLVENMPDGNAQRPGDIVTSMSGQTIEILNTDAEGRLVLADALWYCQDKFRPQLMIDLATLTGAMMVSLGTEHAGFFANDDTIADQLFLAGKDVGEKTWRMPLHDNYDKLLRSDVADMKNIGGRYAGAITAAQFLQRFVNNTKWAHIDIAGTTWSSKDSPTVPKGGTGYGVRLLDRFVADNYE